MGEYQANSHKSKAEQGEKEERKIQKVVSTKPKTRKNEGRKLMNIFISEDAANVKSYVFMDVLVPAIKKAISDIVTDGVDMILYGESRNRKNKSGTPKISYRDYYSSGKSSRDSEPRLRNRFDYDDIVFNTRGEAMAVLDQMGGVIEQYDFVTVADFYDMADLTAPHTANKYGWYNLRNAEVVRVRDGFIVKLPKAVVID